MGRVGALLAIILGVAGSLSVGVAIKLTLIEADEVNFFWLLLYSPGLLLSFALIASGIRLSIRSNYNEAKPKKTAHKPKKTTQTQVKYDQHQVGVLREAIFTVVRESQGITRTDLIKQLKATEWDIDQALHELMLRRRITQESKTDKFVLEEGK